MHDTDKQEAVTAAENFVAARTKAGHVIDTIRADARLLHRRASELAHSDPTPENIRGLYRAEVLLAHASVHDPSNLAAQNMMRQAADGKLATGVPAASTVLTRTNRVIEEISERGRALTGEAGHSFAEKVQLGRIVDTVIRR